MSWDRIERQKENTAIQDKVVIKWGRGKSMASYCDLDSIKPSEILAKRLTFCAFLLVRFLASISVVFGSSAAARVNDDYRSLTTGNRSAASTGTMPAGGTTASSINGVLDSQSATVSSGGVFTITATKPATVETGTSNSFTVSRIFYVGITGSDVSGVGNLAYPFLTIQKGIASAASGDSVVVLAGTYVGPVNVTKSIFLIGSIGGTTTIEAPVGFDASSPTAYDYALLNFTTERAIVHIGTTTPINVLMRGFTVDGKTLGPPHTANVSYSGILAEKCTVTVVSNTVKNILPVDAGSILDSDGLQRNGRGIHVRGSGAVAVVDTNTIQETNRFHILINATDDTSRHAAVSPQAVVRKNIVTGKGSYGGGQKGIWFNNGAWGTISDNAISAMDYVDAGLEPERASGIVVRYGFLDPAHRRIISNNTLTTASHVNNKGMYLQGTRDSVVGNTIAGFRWGVEVHDGHATKLARNMITGGIIGVLVQCEDGTDTPDSVMIGGSAAGKNTITGQDLAAGGFAISMSFREAIYALEAFRSTIPVDARYNNFGVHTEAEVKARIWDCADTTGLVNGYPIDTVLYYPFDGMLATGVGGSLQGPYAGEVVPKVFQLMQNYPNPFNPSTTISYGLPRKSAVQLSVFNALGQQVAQLANGDMEAGYHQMRFDGSGLSSGVYFYRIQAGSFVETRRLLLVR